MHNQRHREFKVSASPILGLVEPIPSLSFAAVPSDRIMNRSLDGYVTRLLELGHFERRSRGGWRFGTKVISDAVVRRLIASGRAEVIRDRLVLKRGTSRDANNILRR